MVKLYHITDAEVARQATLAGQYAPEALTREGFIHCSYRHQVLAVANRLFRGRPNLVLLEIDSARVDCRIVDENLEGGKELFPHIYGPLDMTAVVSILPLTSDAEGFNAISGDERFAPAEGAAPADSAARARACATRCAVNPQCNRAVLSFTDGSELHFEHTLQNRWAKASAGKSLADEVCLSLRLFRLNAKHLQLFFEDGSDAEFLPPFLPGSGLT